MMEQGLQRIEVLAPFFQLALDKLEQLFYKLLTGQYFHPEP
jgi:hypothetical protein